MKLAPGTHTQREAVPMEEMALELLQFFDKHPATRTRNSRKEGRGCQ